MVRPGLTKYRMHPAVLNRLDKSLNVAKSLLTATVSNQQSCSLVGNSRMCCNFVVEPKVGVDDRHFRACLESSRFGCEPSGHQLDHGDSDPRFGLSGKASKSLLNRRERLSQPKVRSTIQRHCRTRNPWLFRGRFTIERVRCKTVATHSTSLPA